MAHSPSSRKIPVPLQILKSVFSPTHIRDGIPVRLQKRLKTHFSDGIPVPFGKNNLYLFYLFLLSTIIKARRQDKENLNAQQINNVLFAGVEHQVLAFHSASIDMINVIIFDHNKL